MIEPKWYKDEYRVSTYGDIYSLTKHPGGEIWIDSSSQDTVRINPHLYRTEESFNADSLEFTESDGLYQYTHRYGRQPATGRKYVSSLVQHLDHPQLQLEQQLYLLSQQNPASFIVRTDIVQEDKVVPFCIVQYDATQYARSNVCLYPCWVQEGDSVVTQISSANSTDEFARVKERINKGIDSFEFVYSNEKGEYFVTIPMHLDPHLVPFLLQYLHEETLPERVDETMITPPELDLYVEMSSQEV